MTFSVKVQPSGHHFSVEDHESVLSAALGAGIVLPYGCKNGACGSCKGKVIEGKVTHDPHQLTALSADEAAKGMALFCCAHPQSDLIIEVREVQGAGDIPIKKLPCRVSKIERAASDVVIVSLQLPASERFQYLAGQYIEIILRDGKRRSYSMASAPHQADHIELHIRHVPGGLFTDQVFGVRPTILKERDILRFEGPFGTFILREDSDKPIIFVASGTGFAPIKSMMEHAILKQIDRPITLYWGARRPNDLYCAQLANSWQDALPQFQFIPVVSDSLPVDHWAGRTGFVHRAVMDDFDDLSGYQVYACGAPVMVDAARHDFTALRALPENEFYADAFTTEADLAAAKKS